MTSSGRLLDESTVPSEPVMLHLLDPSTGHVVQAWLMAQQTVITIGRDLEQDVLISHPHVSRQHAELRYGNSQWQLVSLGRNGVVIEGKRVTDAVACNGLVFRLGPDGPTLRFFDTPPAANNTMTITADSAPKFALKVDDTRVDEDVREIVDGDYFQQLQERAHELRRRRGG